MISNLTGHNYEIVPDLQPYRDAHPVEVATFDGIRSCHLFDLAQPQIVEGYQAPHPHYPMLRQWNVGGRTFPAGLSAGAAAFIAGPPAQPAVVVPNDDIDEDFVVPDNQSEEEDETYEEEELWMSDD